MFNNLLLSPISLLLYLFIWNDSTFAGAWTQPKGSYFLKISSSFLFATKEFNHKGDVLNIFQERIIYKDASFQDWNQVFYLEYGLSKRITLISNLAFKSLRSKRTELIGGGASRRIVTLYTVGLSDFTVAARYALVDAPLVFSVQTGIKLPLGYDSKPEDDGAPLGTGKVDFEGHLLFGKSLYPFPFYITSGIGYRRRTGPLHDQILSTVEVGWTAARLVVKVNYDGLRSTVAPPDIVGQPVVAPLPGGGGALPNIIVGDQNISKISPSVIFSLKQGLEIQVELSSIIGGKNTVKGISYSAGLILKL